MTAEVLEKGADYAPGEAELLETFLLGVLADNDGLCLDNQPERVALATALTNILLSAAKEGGVIDFVRLLEATQTTRYSASFPLST